MFKYASSYVQRVTHKTLKYAVLFTRTTHTVLYFSMETINSGALLCSKYLTRSYWTTELDRVYRRNTYTNVQARFHEMYTNNTVFRTQLQFPTTLTNYNTTRTTCCLKRQTTRREGLKCHCIETSFPFDFVRSRTSQAT